jgi:hypothetical protein
LYYTNPYEQKETSIKKNERTHPEKLELVCCPFQQLSYTNPYEQKRNSKQNKKMFGQLYYTNPYEQKETAIKIKKERTHPEKLENTTIEDVLGIQSVLLQLR